MKSIHIFYCVVTSQFILHSSRLSESFTASPLLSFSRHVNRRTHLALDFHEQTRQKHPLWNIHRLSYPQVYRGTESSKLLLTSTSQPSRNPHKTNDSSSRLSASSNGMDDFSSTIMTVSRKISSTNNTKEDDIDTEIQRLLEEEGEKDGLKQAAELLKKKLEERIANNVETTVPLSRTTWNMIFNAIEERTANADENASENIRRMEEQAILNGGSASFPMQSEARNEMTEMYATLKNINQLRLFGAASTGTPKITPTSSDQANDKRIFRLLPAGGSYTLPPTVLESALDLPMTALTPKPSNTLLFLGVACAIAEGIFSLTTGTSLDLLVLATLSLFVMDRIFVNGAVSESLVRAVSPGMQSKITRHEAGHFLVAYLLGCPVEGIVLSAWAALQDRRFGTRAVSAGTSFFDPELSMQINKSAGATVTRSAIDRYSIIVMAGIAAEADSFGQADGGAGDEMALVAFLLQLSGGGRNSTSNKKWNSDTIRNQARWAAMQAILLLRHYRPAYEALVDTLERGNDTLADCIYAIEKAARDYNLQPIQQPIGYIEEDKATGAIVWSTILENDKPKIDSTISSPIVSSPSSSSSALFVETVESPSVLNGQKQRPVLTSKKPNNSDETFNLEEAQKSLQVYRAEIERKLQQVERQLNELQ